MPERFRPDRFSQIASIRADGIRSSGFDRKILGVDRDLASTMTWQQLGPWWLEELESDPAYEAEIEPLLLGLLDPQPESLYVDLGCGEGRVMAAVTRAGGSVVGCDINPLLLDQARRHGAVVRAALPDLGWVRTKVFDGAYVGLVLEHLSDETEFFAQVALSVRSGGVLALVINHPIWTAPDSSPMEVAGGETLWRPGIYFGRGHSDEPAGKKKVRFYHRTLSDLLNSASAAGWDLERLEERGISKEQTARLPDLLGQEHIPRVLGARWRQR